MLYDSGIGGFVMTIRANLRNLSHVGLVKTLRVNREFGRSCYCWFWFSYYYFLDM